MPEELVLFKTSKVECFECTALDNGVEGLLVNFCKSISIRLERKY